MDFVKNKSELQEEMKSKCFDGYQIVYKHNSETLGCEMKFGLYAPSHSPSEKLVVLFFLSGLTCNTDNFIQKSGFQRFASKHRIIVVNPDTSPRFRMDGDDESESYGQSAGFYLDATTPKWERYRMYSYIVNELHPLIMRNFAVDPKKCGIFGHSMGGHGAMVIGLRNPTLFQSISAFAPICDAPSSTWGKLAFPQYLGNDTNAHNSYSATHLASEYAGPKRSIFIDQGLADPFLPRGDLKPEGLVERHSNAVSINLRQHPDYDHGYYFITTFIEDHFEFHAESLKSLS